MVCTKCGNELDDGDLFCGKCGARVKEEAAESLRDNQNSQSKQGSEGDSKIADGANASNAGQKMLGTKMVRRQPQQIKPKPLVVGGRCRYCGTKMSADKPICPGCGAKSPEQKVKEKEQSSRLVSVAEVKRAADIGRGLDDDPFSGGFWGNDGCISCLGLINPFFWIGRSYRSKAKKALEDGDIKLAKECKDTSVKYDIAGWVSTIWFFLILYLVARNMK